MKIEITNEHGIEVKRGVLHDGGCGHCGRYEDVIVIRLGRYSQGWITRFCRDCWNDTVRQVERLSATGKANAE
jgi:hypothetical protein